MLCSSLGAGDGGVAVRGFRMPTNPQRAGPSKEGLLDWPHWDMDPALKVSGSIKLMWKQTLLQPGSAPASQEMSPGLMQCSNPGSGAWDTPCTRAQRCWEARLAEQTLLGYYLSVNLSARSAAPFNLRLWNSPSGFCLPLAAPFPRSG